MRGKRYEVVCSFDTETSNYAYVDERGDERHTAWCVLYTCEDLRACGIRHYEVGAGDVRFFRSAAHVISYFDELMAWGRDRGVVPVVAGYNLLFDLQTLMAALNEEHPMRATAQSSANAYVVDVLDADGGETLLRFWDCFHLELRGLAAMGEVAGVPKKSGEWDYDLVRTPETPLTDEELEYAAYDVHIIPAYLRYLLEANTWMRARDLSYQVLTKTSVVRTFARREIGEIEFRDVRGRASTLYASFISLCSKEFWRDYDEYALQRACFRGGFTFTAAEFASRVVRRVYSLDETSAHHAFINGRKIPVGFRPVRGAALQAVCESIVETPLASVLERYDQPWVYGVHACVRLTNIRLRRGSAFDEWGIALIPQGKMSVVPASVLGNGGSPSPRNAISDEDVARSGYVDRATNPVFAYSKLMSADACELHVSEVELWALTRVYEWDSMDAVYGEVSTSWVLPPDYVTLQSNTLFSQKQAMKRLLAGYEEGVPYDGDIDPSIPESIAVECRAGISERRFLESFYNSTVKGMFNGIYGVQAQNVMRPDYKVESGDLVIDDDTRITRENFHDREPKTKKVLYTYGLRIVGGSRLQLVLAIELVHAALGSRVRIVGGDTDSIKVSVDDDVSAGEVTRSLEPLHAAISSAIARTQERVRGAYQDLCSTLDSVGEFEIENDEPYPEHVELWNKARVTWDGSHAHVTCAGLSRPRGAYTIESAIEELMCMGWAFGDAVSTCLGYNTYVDNSISHALERTDPRASSRVRLTVVDHEGNVCDIDAPEAIALYPSARNVADTNKRSNFYNVQYIRSKGGTIDTAEKRIWFDGERLHVERIGECGWTSVV